MPSVVKTIVSLSLMALFVGHGHAEQALFQTSFVDADGKPCACMYGVQPRTTRLTDVTAILDSRQDLSIRKIEGGGKMMLIIDTSIGQLTVMSDNEGMVSHVSLWLDSPVPLAELTNALGVPQRQVVDSMHVGYVYDRATDMPLVIGALGDDLQKSGVTSIEVGDLALNWFPENVHPYPWVPAPSGSRFVLVRSAV